MAAEEHRRLQSAYTGETIRCCALAVVLIAGETEALVCLARGEVLWWALSHLLTVPVAYLLGIAWVDFQAARDAAKAADAELWEDANA